jgi:hypothetical protein
VIFDIFNNQNTPEKESAKFLYMVHACSKNVEWCLNSFAFTFGL